MIEITIKKAEANQRLDKYVKKLLNNAPLSFIYKTFRKKDIKINSHPAKAQYIIQEGDVLRVYISEEALDDFNKTDVVKPMNFPHEILYEDENIIIVNKPRGLIVHRASEKEKYTLTDQVLSYLVYKGEYNPKTDVGFTPGPAHRLDRNTSGIVVFGKNIGALQALFDLFKEKNAIEKHYLALVFGELKKDGKIDAPLLKDSDKGIVRVASLKEGAKSALTYYHVLKSNKDFSFLDVNLITGRTHQIRVHLQSIGYPIVCDAKYGNFAMNKEFEKKYALSNQLLHAYLLKFLNVKGELSYLSNKEFRASLPKKEANVLQSILGDYDNAN